MTRLVVAVTGASGSILAVRLLEALAQRDCEVHLVVSDAAQQTLELETDYKLDYLASLADRTYSNRDVSAALASGSFPVTGMVVVPCSVKTLAGIASGYAESLILRAADVCLKERRPLILAVRETPLNAIHLDNMLRVTQAGAIVMPPVPAFYTKPVTVDDICTQFVGRILARFGLSVAGYQVWEG
ncbi:MAG: UbiX family flavin prenyltransferase [Firmicutes bacterium]|nr:UbiX family flavin prenyltransferase [Bacillota bacterium]